GQPFPLLDPNDPQLGTKIMWNFSFKPLYTDDVDLRDPEIASFTAHSNGTPVSFMTVGHFSFYNNVGRIEVPPTPTDPDASASGIRYRFGFYPILEPEPLRGWGLIRYRYINPDTEDNVFEYQPRTRHVRREHASALSDAIGNLAGYSDPGASGGGGGVAAYASTLDPDSYFGFSAKIEDYNYRYIAEKEM